MLLREFEIYKNYLASHKSNLSYGHVYAHTYAHQQQSVRSKSVSGLPFISGLDWFDSILVKYLELTVKACSHQAHGRIEVVVFSQANTFH